MSEETSTELRRRDSLTDAFMGSFFSLLAFAVLAGVFFAELAIDRLINAGAGLLLLVVGAVFLWRARVLSLRSRSASGSRSS